MSKKAVVGAGIWSVIAIGCGARDLDSSRPPADMGADAGGGGESTPPADAGTSPTTALAGIWSGNVKISHPDFAGPPIDRMTMEIGDDGRLSFSGFDEFGYEASFGTPPDYIPLAGSALAHVLVGDGFMLRFTVQSADWQSDHIQFTYTAFSSGLNEGETPETPFTDLTIALTATLVDGKLRVHWTETGTEYTAPLAAIADGDLTR